MMIVIYTLTVYALLALPATVFSMRISGEFLQNRDNKWITVVVFWPVILFVTILDLVMERGPKWINMQAHGKENPHE